jgi:alpha-amylase/alpha-mannosidase (GH57 family)
MNKHICIHGHFYQPPRENPWLEEIEFQESAYPYHDWNEKITDECYAPNTASRILDSEDRIIEITNTYAKISFDFGPTLLSWMEKKKPDVYQAILDADKLSIENFSGHGSAIAQAYNHMIMPLANKRDKYTQAIWGIKDFEKRFNRYPEGMWLPETAVDVETLEVLVSLGIKFTVIAQRQAQRVKRTGETESWADATEEKIDSTMPYLCILPSGHSINIFFYDGPISQEISFGKLLKNGEGFAKKLLSAFSDERDHPQIVHIATDGETFGHHHRFGDMALSFCLNYIESGNHAKITNYGEYLDKHPPTHIVEIVENSSWSCVHGVERWKDNCGCNSGNQPKWNQAWRKPLREAMDWLRDTLITIYNDGASCHFKDPWSVRNDYIEVILDRSTKNVKAFLNRHASRKLTMKDKVMVLKLLEMQRNTMLMYTSCGWFFDDASGIETIQIMQYASKAIQYAEELTGLPLESEYLEYLKKTPCNMFEDAAIIYEKFVTPARSDLLRVGAHYSISSIFEDCPEEEMKTFHYTVKSKVCNRTEAGKLILSIGKADISSDITWDTKIIDFAVMHLGDHNISGGARNFKGDEDFSVMQSEIMDAFEKGSVHEVIRLMDKHFSNNIYSIWHLFKDEQRRLLHRILQLTYREAEASYRQIYDNNYAIMNIFHGLNMKIPRPFFAAAEYILNEDMKQLFKDSSLNVDSLGKLINEAEKWNIKIDKTTLSYMVSLWLNTIMDKIRKQPEDLQLFEMIDKTLEIVKPLSLSLDLWKAQNNYFSLWNDVYRTMKDKAEKGDSFAGSWVENFLKLGYYLNVKV